MHSVRVYDPDRRPSHWTDLIRPGQYAAFAKIIETSAPCDADGRPFASAADATCLIFDGFDEAESFCARQVLRAPGIRFDVFDSAGRLNPPLLMVVHPDRIASLEGNPRGMRSRRIIAAVLTAAAIPLMWYDYWSSRGRLIFPTVIAINLLVVAARLVQLNRSYAHAAQERQRRVDEHRQGSITSGPG